jgi:two-component system chemotaxis sensor kinase CheA
VRPVPEGQRAPAAGAAGPAGTLRVDLRRIDAALERSTDALTQVKLLQQRYEELRHELASLRNVRLPRPDDAPRALARITAGILASTSAMGAVVRELGTVVHDFSTDIDSLDDAVHGLRLVPCAGLVGHLERVARDAASALGRKALLVVDGGGLDIDKALLDALKGPLTHAVRNAVDHGIEPTDERAAAGKPAVGELRLILREERKALHVLFSDDGRGIDRAAVRERLGADAATLDDKALLARLLRAGRSTRDTVSEISGRGIGLGALASLADELHGDVTLTSQPGRGTSVVLKLPLRLSQVDVRTVESGGLVLMLPQSGMCRVDRATDEQRVPALGALLGCPDGAPVAHVVTLQGRDRRARFGVSHLGKREQVVQQPVGAHLGKLPFVSGVTLAADGDPAWILDPRALVDSGAGAADLDLAPGAAVRRILLVDDNPAVRKRLHDDLTRAGHDVVLAFDGLTALDRLEAMRFDAVVSDVQMPRLDGFGLLERCGGRLPVVLMSSLDDAATTRRARDLGAVAFLVKAADLGSRVEAVLADIFSRNLEASP